MTTQSAAATGNRRIVIVGNYTFTGKRLGKGNFAVVDEAVHNALQIKVAIKIMNVSEIREEYVIRNLHREGKIMAKLSHPCIAALFQTMHHGNMYYLVTELVSGGDLCHHIRSQRNGKLDETAARGLARQLISAIAHMHKMGVVHRDLKMENIMLCPTNERIKIVDFGLSNVCGGEKLLRTHCGSPEYAAPELFIEGKHYGPEVDLWSLGVILYGMVVGHLPFVSGSRDGTQRRRKLLDQIRHGITAHQRKALAVLSSEFRTMLARLLVAEPERRISVTELMTHPWVSERGRKTVRSESQRHLDDGVRVHIARQVAALLKAADWMDVQHAVESAPLGDVAGMYNMLAHRVLNAAALDIVVAAARSSQPLTHRSVDSVAGGRVHQVVQHVEVRKRPIGNASDRTIRIRKTYVAGRTRASTHREVEAEAEVAKSRTPGGDAMTRRNNNVCLFEKFIYDCSTYSSARSKKSKVDTSNATYTVLHPARGDVHRSKSLNTKPGHHGSHLPRPVQMPASATPKQQQPSVTITPRNTKRRSLLPVLQSNRSPTQPPPHTSESVQSRGAASAAGGCNVIDRIANVRQLPAPLTSPLRRQPIGGRKIDLSNEPIARSIAGYMSRNIGDAKLESLRCKIIK